MTKDIRSASWREATAGRSKDKNKALRNNIMEGVARKEIFQQGGHEKKRRETMQDPEATGLRNGVEAPPPAREKKGGSASGELAAWNSTGPFGPWRCFSGEMPRTVRRSPARILSPYR